MPQYTDTQIFEALRKARKGRLSSMDDPRFAALFKDANSTWHQSSSPTSGLTFYDLEPGAKFLYPVPTPLRNKIPRESGKGGIQASWRAVTAINSTGVYLGVSGGNRGGVIQNTTTDYTANYRGIGLEGNVDFEAQYAGEPAFDVRGVNTKTLLEAVMIGEEQMILGGDTSLALNGGAATPTPNLSDSSTGGSLLNTTTYSVICVAMTLDAFLRGSVSATGINASVTRTNADNSSDTFGGGAGKQSANVTITTSGTGSNTHSITASLTTAVLGAAAYAWYISTPAGTERLAGITGVATFTFTALPTGTNQLASSLGTADTSRNSLAFDGLITQAATAGSGAYTLALGATLTSNNAGGIVELENMNKDRWDNFRLGFTDYWCNSQQALDIDKKILSAGGSPGAQRFIFQTAQDAIRGGIMTREYINRYTMDGAQVIRINVHPYMPPGTILATRDTSPYPLSNVGNIIQIVARQEYFQVLWPLRSRKWEHGVYADEVLQHYFPPSMGLIYDIRPG